MIASQQPTVIRQLEFGSMSELGTGLYLVQAIIFYRPSNDGLPRQSSQCQKNDRLTEFNGSIKKWFALFNFGGCRLIVGRRTSADVGHHAIDQLKTIVPISCGRLIGKPRLVKRPKQPVSATVASEHSAGSVGAVCSGSKPDHQQVGRCLAKVGYRFAPVFLIRVCLAFDLGDRAAMFNQAIALSTPLNATVQAAPRSAAQASDSEPPWLPLCVPESSVACRSRNLFFTFR